MPTLRVFTKGSTVAPQTLFRVLEIRSRCRFRRAAPQLRLAGQRRVRGAWPGRGCYGASSPLMCSHVPAAADACGYSRRSTHRTSRGPFSSAWSFRRAPHRRPRPVPKAPGLRPTGTWASKPAPDSRRERKSRETHGQNDNFGSALAPGRGRAPRDCCGAGRARSHHLNPPPAGPGSTSPKENLTLRVLSDVDYPLIRTIRRTRAASGLRARCVFVMCIGRDESELHRVNRSY